MQLTIGQNLGNNRVKIEYREHGKKSSHMPSYKIDKRMADEFVKKYNEQSSVLSRITAGLSIMGGFCAYKSAPFDNKFAKFIIGTPIGAVIGALFGACFSYIWKNNIMEKYKVEQF